MIKVLYYQLPSLSIVQQVAYNHAEFIHHDYLDEGVHTPIV
jgi:hypothetical protein